jgi:hypothetical protein
MQYNEQSRCVGARRLRPYTQFIDNRTTFMQAIIFIGIPASGKSTFFKQQFVDTYTGDSTSI